MEISLFEVDTFFFSTPFISFTPRERGLAGSVCGRISSTRLQKVSTTGPQVPSPLVGALKKWWLWGEGAGEGRLGKQLSLCPPAPRLQGRSPPRLASTGDLPT